MSHLSEEAKRELRIRIDLQERLDRIADWHSRESGAGGLVGDNCVECGLPWPCDTRAMADGTYIEMEGLA